MREFLEKESLKNVNTALKTIDDKNLTSYFIEPEETKTTPTVIEILDAIGTQTDYQSGPPIPLIKFMRGLFLLMKKWPSKNNLVWVSQMK